jgi:plasmid stability protein
MATLQVRDIDNRLYDCLKVSAKLQNRSISQEVITIIQNYLNSPQKTTVNTTLEFLALSGAWQDAKSAQEIVTDIRSNRSKSSRFGGNHGVFD